MAAVRRVTGADVGARSSSSYIVLESTLPRHTEPPRYAGGVESVVAERTVWAWCQAAADAPGFDSITYTEADGMSFVDPAGGEVGVSLGRFLFRVP